MTKRCVPERGCAREAWGGRPLGEGASVGTVTAELWEPLGWGGLWGTAASAGGDSGGRTFPCSVLCVCPEPYGRDTWVTKTMGSGPSEAHEP